MDPANEHPFQAAVEIQGAMLGKHEEEVSAARRAVDTLAAQMDDLTKQFHFFCMESSSTRSADAPEPRVNNPPAIRVSRPSVCHF